MAATSEHPLILHEARHLARAGVAARVLATAEVVEVHVVLSAQRDGRGGVAAEAAADGVGDDPEALPELVPVSGLGRRSSALGGPLEGWLVASKGLGPRPRRG